MGLIPLLPAVEELAGLVISAEASKQADQNYSNAFFSGEGCGIKTSVSNESAAKKEEIMKFVSQAMAPPFYEAFWEMFTSLIAPIASAVGIPYFVCKHTIAKMIVDNLMGKPSPDLPSPVIPSCSPKIVDIISSGEIDESLPINPEKAMPKAKRG